MIPSTDYTAQVGIYSFNGEGKWRIVSYCEAPSLTMEEIETGKREDFGIGGATSAAFGPIEGLYYDHPSGQIMRDCSGNTRGFDIPVEQSGQQEANGTPPSPWIATKDRKPTGSDALNNDRTVFVLYMDGSAGDSEWNDLGDRVTHWMPIPPLPKEKEVDPFKEWDKKTFGCDQFICDSAHRRKIWRAGIDHAISRFRKPDEPLPNLD